MSQNYSVFGNFGNFHPKSGERNQANEDCTHNLCFTAAQFRKIHCFTVIFIAFVRNENLEDWVQESYLSGQFAQQGDDKEKSSLPFSICQRLGCTSVKIAEGWPQDMIRCSSFFFLVIEDLESDLVYIRVVCTKERADPPRVGDAPDVVRSRDGSISFSQIWLIAICLSDN